MQIALFTKKITIQKQTASADGHANHRNTWEDYFTCWATPGGESGTESDTTGVTQARPDATFTVRWCSETSVIEPTGYRVVLGDTIYNIISIDHQNYKCKSLKLKCEKVER